MQRLRTVTLLDVKAVAGHHVMPAALLLNLAETVRHLLLPAETVVLGK